MRGNKPSKAGGWKREHFKGGVDSSLRESSRNFQTKLLTGATGLKLGRVTHVNKEPLFQQASVTVRTVQTDLIGQAMWPGPNVEVNGAGKAGGTQEQVHGLFVSPQEGQTVVMGFQDGSIYHPMVLNLYPTYASHDPTLEPLHFLPITSKGHDADDIILGHFTGAYMALRAALLPGQIDLYAPTEIVAEADTGIELISHAFITEDADLNIDLTAGTTMDLKSNLAMTLDAGTTMDLLSALAMTLDSSLTMDLKSALAMKLDAGTAFEMTATTTADMTADGQFTITGNGLDLLADTGNILIKADAGTVTIIGLGGIPQPSVRGTMLILSLTTILSSLVSLTSSMAAETHIGNLGFPTSVPQNAASYTAVGVTLANELSNLSNLLSTGVLIS